MSRVQNRLDELGIVLPTPPSPAGVYVPALRTGPYVHTAGQLPLIDGALSTTGKVGAEVTVPEAADLARTCALNALAVVGQLVGDLDQVVRVVKMTGFVASAPNFTQQPSVVNGASELLGDVLGQAGTHARSAVGVAVLPMDSPVEVELQVELEGHEETR